MATAGASALAGRCGLHEWAVPLLGLASLQVLWIPAAGAFRRRTRTALAQSARPADEHTGIHTVPLGLAVITAGIVGMSATGAARWALPSVAGGCLALTWLLTIGCLGRFLRALTFRGFALQSVDGAWFLVPATLLGTAIATKDTAALLASPGVPALAVMALAAALVGWCGYWAVAVAALVRVRRFGLRGAPQAPWWIAMGCAGLAAAALGRMLDGSPSRTALRIFLVVATTATEICAIVLLVPVLIIGVRFLLSHCRYRATAPWPPTFSTAVFALGSLQTGEVLHSPAFRLLGMAAAFATLAFWAVTAGWNAKWLIPVPLFRGHSGCDDGGSDGRQGTASSGQAPRA